MLSAKADEFGQCCPEPTSEPHRSRQLGAESSLQRQDLVNAGCPRILLVSLPKAAYRPVMVGSFEDAVGASRRNVADFMARELAENIRHKGFKSGMGRVALLCSGGRNRGHASAAAPAGPARRMPRRPASTGSSETRPPSNRFWPRSTLLPPPTGGACSPASPAFTVPQPSPRGAGIGRRQGRAERREPDRQHSCRRPLRRAAQYVAGPERSTAAAFRAAVLASAPGELSIVFEASRLRRTPHPTDRRTSAAKASLCALSWAVDRVWCLSSSAL